MALVVCGSTLSLNSVILAGAALSLSACADTPPSAKVLDWRMVRDQKAGTYTFTAEAHLEDDGKGLFAPELTLTDERGCKHFELLELISKDDASEQDPMLFHLKSSFPYKYRVSRATLDIYYREPQIGSDPALKPVFSEERVVDAALKPPASPTKPCGPSRQEQNAAKVADDTNDPDINVENTSREEIVATAINTAGFLCARVTDMWPSGDDIMVTCVEYRNGRGRVKYRIDTTDMRVIQLN